MGQLGERSDDILLCINGRRGTFYGYGVGYGGDHDMCSAMCSAVMTNLASARFAGDSLELFVCLGRARQGSGTKRELKRQTNGAFGVFCGLWVNSKPKIFSQQQQQDVSGIEALTKAANRGHCP